MTTPTVLPALPEPAALSPVQWSARLAAYTGRGRHGDDPAVIACRQALSYWRCRRVIDAEQDHIGASGLAALVETLLRPLIVDTGNADTDVTNTAVTA